jgi:hypothetical protein
MPDEFSTVRIDNFLKRQAEKEAEAERQREETRRRAAADPDNRPIPEREPEPKARGWNHKSKPAESDSLFRVRWHGDPDDTPLREWLVENTVPKVGTGLISGQWGTYKTFVAFALSACVMAKLPFAGRKVERQGGVLFIALEGQDEIRVRLQAVIEHKVAGKFADDVAVDIDHMPYAWITACPKLSAPDAFEKLAAVIRPVVEILHLKFGLPLVLIIIDTLSPAAQFKDASNTSENQQVMSALKALANAFECFVMCLDHFGKDVSTGTRDSSVKESDVDTVLALLGERALSGLVENPRMALRKIRGGASGQVIPFATRPVQVVDIDPTGHEKIDETLVIDFAEQPETMRAAQKRERWPKGLSIFKRAFDNSLEKFGTELRPFFDGPNVRAVKRNHVRDEFLVSYPAENNKAKREAFLRSARDAVERGIMVAREINAEHWFWSLTN